MKILAKRSLCVLSLCVWSLCVAIFKMAKTKLKKDAISEDVLEMRNVAFECPICVSLAVSGPIMQCKNGHHICNNCASKVDKCLSCKEKIDIRALQLEKLREVTPFPCQFMENGCKVVLKLKDLQQHQDQCRHGLCSTCKDILQSHYRINAKRRF
jgi:hypothetical protein